MQTFLDENGKAETIYGCYGIGVSRLVASCDWTKTMIKVVSGQRDSPFIVDIIVSKL